MFRDSGKNRSTPPEVVPFLSPPSHFLLTVKVYGRNGSVNTGSTRLYFGSFVHVAINGPYKFVSTCVGGNSSKGVSSYRLLILSSFGLSTIKKLHFCIREWRSVR